MKLEFSRTDFQKKKSPNIKFNGKPSSGSRVVSHGRTDGLTDMAKLAVAFFSTFAKAPNNTSQWNLQAIRETRTKKTEHRLSLHRKSASMMLDFLISVVRDRYSTAPPSPWRCGPTRGPWTPHSWGFSITHNDASQSVGLLWTRDQRVVETSTWQHTTHTTDRHPCPPVGFEPTI